MSDDPWSRDETEDAPPDLNPTPDGYLRMLELGTTRSLRPNYPGKWKQLGRGELGIWCPSCERGVTLPRDFPLNVDGLSEEVWTCQRCGLSSLLHLVESPKEQEQE